MDSLRFLERTSKARPLPLYVIHGEEDFLRRQVLKALRAIVVGPEADAMDVSVHAGDKATYAEVHDELETVPFFTPRRLVLVENADPFVSKFRPQLEKAVARLPDRATLVLDVKTWPANTRLAKLVDADATLVCKPLSQSQVAPWCVSWARSQHRKQLAGPAADLLVELVGPELGLLDQELLKLAVYVGSRTSIELEDVDRLVGSSRAENVFKILDAVGSARPALALNMLERLLDQGEEPLRILGALGSQLRKLAQAGRLYQQGMAMPAALARVGVNPYFAKSAEQQLRHLGSRRAGHVYEWLLEIDSGLKGGSPLPPRTLLERLVLRLARQV